MNRHRNRPNARIAALAALAIVGLVTVQGGEIASAHEAVRLDQCANRDTTCDTANPGRWVNGNLNSSKATYREGDSVPYRATMSDLKVGATYSFSLEYDSTESGRHAIDYLTSFNRTESTADPCAGITCGGSTDTLTIPADPHVIAAGVTPIGGSFTLHGGNFVDAGTTVPNSGNLCPGSSCTIAANPSGFSLSGTYAGSSRTSTTVYFTANATSAVLAWGGHIATRMDWGMTGSAATISGSPYHMRLKGLGCSKYSTCGVGQTDRSLSSDAVVYPGKITAHKSVTPTTSQAFSFTATPAPLTSFSLDGSGTATSSKSFAAITGFTTYTIDEAALAGWSFDSVSCTVGTPNGGSWKAATTGVVIDLREGENYDCIFVNSAIPTRSISLTKTVAPTTFAAAGDVLTYTYTITNSGQATLGPTQFTVTDDRINSGKKFDCGPAGKTLTSEQFVSCTADYTVTADDVKAGKVTNTATATGADLTSDPADATATFAAAPTTTSTTAAPTTTTVPVSTTAVVQEVTTTRPVDSTVLLLGGNVTATTVRSNVALPTTGGDSWPGLGAALVALLAGVMVLVARLRRPS